MARYSREQRERAAELYKLYEHSAADVIRELGYPGREALRMWYRDWLEERRTGVPSRRGERYSRYTDERKRTAVEHCLTHGRRMSWTMRRLGYPSRGVLAAWIDELAPANAGSGAARWRTRSSVWQWRGWPRAARRRGRSRRRWAWRRRS
ncbi:hypothetical protein [Bifidobacterium pullorum]|uniref:hypothetical protein n=1 Tax=Bifidobacterium pullorum TaxID=78448 RepID=UPI003F20C091